MSLSIQIITKDNWRELTRLKVRDEQKKFVASMEKVLEIFRADEKIQNAIITYAPENDGTRKEVVRQFWLQGKWRDFGWRDSSRARLR